MQLLLLGPDSFLLLYLPPLQLLHFLCDAEEVFEGWEHLWFKMIHHVVSDRIV